MNIVKTEKEVDDLLEVVAEHEDEGTVQFPGMSYEMGIRAGIEWLLGYRADYPME